jgi:photosystem II stability/assembly factor-like uncharacterized protein
MKVKVFTVLIMLISLSYGFYAINSDDDTKRAPISTQTTPVNYQEYVFGPALDGPLSSISESFESTTFPPTGWVKISPLAGSTGWNRQTLGTTPVPGFNGGTIYTPVGGGVGLAFCNYITGNASGGASGPCDQWLVSPQITNVQPNDSITFWIWKFGTYKDNMIVRISTTTPTVAGMTVLVDSIPYQVADSGWVQKKYRVGSLVPAGSNIYVGLREYCADVAVDGACFAVDLFNYVQVTGPVVPTGTWTEQTSGLTTVLYSVSAVDDNVAWVCGASGKVLKTTNKGANWVDKSGTIPTTYALYNVYAWNTNVCVITGVAGTNTSIFTTSDGGTTWTTANTHAGFGDDMFMTSATDAYFIGDPIAGNWDLLKSTNAGFNWATWSTLPTTNTSGTYNNAAWQQGNQVWFESVGLSTIHYTSNLGVNWSSQTIPLAELTAICFNSATNGLAGGSSTSPGLLKTTNSGVNWTTLTNPYPTSSTSGIVGASTTYWLSQQGTGISISTNEGTSWTTAYTAPAGNFYHMTKSRAGATIWAVRSNGGISRYGQPILGVTPISSEVPSTYSLNQNYPNPFNPVTKINFALPKSGLVTLKVYDILGKEVATVVNEFKNAGTYNVEFNGSALASGVYLYKIESNGFTDIKKMMLVK